MEKGARIAQGADPRAVQELCRHELVERVLADVLADMTVCRLEGWDVLELPLMLREEMDGIIQRATRTRNAHVETVSKSERVGTMRGIGETPEERYATLERIARALERIADAGEARNRMAEETMRRHEAIEELVEQMREVSE